MEYKKLRKIFISLLLILSGCASIDDRLNESPDYSYSPKAPLLDVKNCIKKHWQNYSITQERSENGNDIIAVMNPVHLNVAVAVATFRTTNDGQSLVEIRKSNLCSDSICEIRSICD